MIECKICGREFKNYGGLSTHIKKAHEISSKDYFIQYLNNNIHPVCYCGEKTNFINLRKGFRKFCCSSCSTKSEETQEKLQKTMVAVHGVKHALQSKKFKDKCKKTSFKRFGTENPAGCKEVRDKMKETCLERFGEDSYSKTKEFRKKYKQTCQKRFGTENPSQSEEVQEKRKQTCLERFGEDSYSKTKEFLEKCKQTCQERFGTDNPSQNKEVQEEIKKTRLKQDTEKAKKLFSDLGFEIIGKYKDRKYLTTFRCKSCNFEFEEIPFNLSGRDHKCPNCDPFIRPESSLKLEEVREKIRQTNIKNIGVGNPFESKEIQKRAFEIKFKTLVENAVNLFLGMGFEIVSEYKGARYLTTFKCNNCNFNFIEKPFNLHQRIHKCPVCDPFVRSRLESEIAEKIQTHLFKKFNKQFNILRNDRTIIEPLEIDIFFPELKLSIEVNGDYWHSSEKVIETDKKKVGLIITKGFKHFVIKESDWKINKQSILQKLDNLLKLDYKIYQENQSVFTGFN
jgi:hypothetical protein